MRALSARTLDPGFESRSGHGCLSCPFSTRVAKQLIRTSQASLWSRWGSDTRLKQHAQLLHLKLNDFTSRDIRGRTGLDSAGFWRWRTATRNVEILEFIHRPGFCKHQNNVSGSGSAAVFMWSQELNLFRKRLQKSQIPTPEDTNRSSARNVVFWCIKKYWMMDTVQNPEIVKVRVIS
jgi:hypothetical protein